MFRTDKFAEHLNVYHHNLQSYILKICWIKVSLDHCKCSEMVVNCRMSGNVPTFNGIQMKIRRRSAEASEARNTLVGLCLTWDVEVGLNRLNQIILVETLGLTLQSNGSDKICMKVLYRTILILRQQRPKQQKKNHLP